mmetsp:Transcript_26716/g.61511  ORF Transcript_26716/g.61511 Transcript_26716/m.61511 type:complete len:281 (+) Transcript_26716:150-992(+)|eukprot:1409879-Amphidinium_carterae.1
MPHLLIDRLRSNPLLGPYVLTADDEEKQEGHDGAERPRKRRGIACALVIEMLDIIAALVFIFGSICFLPKYAHEVSIFLDGCALFVAGGAIYVLISFFTSLEAIRHCGCFSLETCENMLYLVGSVFYLIGTVLYWPDKAHTYGIAELKSMSLGVYFNLFSPVFEGTMLFIVGSLLFALAAFINGLNLHEHDHEDIKSRQLLTATTMCYLIGSVLFAVGSVALLPALGGTDAMEASGAWCFIIGSAFYELGSCVSLGRTLRLHRGLSQPAGATELSIEGAE